MKKIFSLILSLSLISSAVVASAAYSVDSSSGYAVVTQDATREEVLAVKPVVEYEITPLEDSVVQSWGLMLPIQSQWINGDAYQVTAKLTNLHDLYTGYTGDFGAARTLQLYMVDLSLDIDSENMAKISQARAGTYTELTPGSFAFQKNTTTGQLKISWTAQSVGNVEAYPSFSYGSDAGEVVEDFEFVATGYILLPAGETITASSKAFATCVLNSEIETGGTFSPTPDVVNVTIPAADNGGDEGDDDDDDPVYDEGYVAVDSIQGLTAEFAAKYEGKFFFTQKLDLAGKAATAHITITRGEEAPKTIERDIATLIGFEGEEPTITAGSIAVTVVTDAADVNPFTFVIE